MSNNLLKLKTMSRIETIFQLYTYYLLNNENIFVNFEKDDNLEKTFNILKLIEKNKEKFEIIAKSTLPENWEWDRIDVLSKSILIYGSYELLINHKNFVISELMKISYALIPSQEVKWINISLQKINT
ncbi:MAG: hypothetical protein K4H23_04665, partial [Mollicutes bacterium PWAP]|nr:hypothetical protein [Mollicutes bacterium PWAP]